MNPRGSPGPDRAALEAALHAAERRTETLEAALAAQKERFDQALDGAGQALWELDVASDTLHCSPQWARQLGLGDEALSLSGEALFEKVHPDDRQNAKTSLRAAITGTAASMDIRFRLRHADRSWRWLLTRARLVRDADGRCLTLLGLQTDITAARQLEAATLDTQLRYRSLYENAPLAFVIWDHEGRITDWNRRAEALFGYPRSGVLGRRFISLLFPETAQDAMVAVARTLVKEGGANQSAVQNRAADGRILHCNWHSVALKNARGVIGGVISLVQDDTARWQAEEIRRRDEARNRALVETSPDAIFMLDTDGYILTVNQQAVRLVKMDDSSDLIGTHAGIWVTENEFARFEEAVLTEPGDRVGFIAQSEFQIATADDGSVLADMNYTTLGDARGEPVGIVLFARDITEKRRQENELTRYREHLEALVRDRTARLDEIISSSPIPTFVIDEQHVITHWNRACEQLTGISGTELIGTCDAWRGFYAEQQPVMADMVMYGEQAGIETLYPGVFDASTVVDVAIEAEAFFPRLNRWLYFMATPLHDTDGRTVGAIETLQDITDRKSAQRALEQAKELAEQAARTKAEFLANMSHEIRTPMNAVIGLAHLALRTPLNPRQRDYIERIKGSGGMLLGLLNDVLDFSKIEAGRLSMESAPFVLDDVLDNVATLVGGRAREKHLEFHFLVAPDVPQDLVGDSLRLSQVLVNLCSNAVKFTERGHVAVRISRLAAGDDGLRLAFRVEDTGIGLTSEQAGRLFQAFSQADTSTTRKFGGTGLGLIISKRIVELMDGEISLDSEPGVGTTFHFHARFGLAPAASHHAGQVPPSLRNGRVLVVDDHPLARDALAASLRQLGMEVTVHDSCDAASGNPGRLVLVDADLPCVLDRTREIKQRPDAPQVVLLASGDTEVIESRAAGHGVDDVVAKPLTLNRLLRLFAALCGTAPAGQGGGESAPPHLAGRRILLAEDIATNRMIAVEMLSEWGLAVDVAENGAIAVDKALAGSYALILMDIQMPELDGLEATRRLRSAGRTLPIVAMTAHTLSEERERCVAAGMDDFVTKPIDPAALLAALVRHIPADAATAGASGTVPPASTSAPAADPVELPPLPGIDTDAGLRRMMGKRHFYRKILGDFLQRFDGNERVIATALADDNREEARRQVHSVKGLAASIGAQALSDAAAQLEQALVRDGDPDAELAAFGRELSVVLDGLRNAFAAG